VFRKSLISLAILIAVTLLAAPPAARAARNPSATGGGQFAYADFTNDYHGTFAFAAVQQQDGTAVGNAEISVYLTGQTSRYHVDIDCVAFAGNEAQLSGIIRQAEGAGQGLEGWRILFIVMDNGEGQQVSDNPDRITEFQFYPPDAPVDCHEVHFFAFPFLVEHGNIQVRP
jgi:hypothetical protein